MRIDQRDECKRHLLRSRAVDAFYKCPLSDMPSQLASHFRDIVRNKLEPTSNPHVIGSNAGSANIFGQHGSITKGFRESFEVGLAAHWSLWYSPA
jgi:hypothetical protein